MPSAWKNLYFSLLHRNNVAHYNGDPNKSSKAFTWSPIVCRRLRIMLLIIPFKINAIFQPQEAFTEVKWEVCNFNFKHN